MASRKECLDAFKFVGINDIVHTPTNIMLDLVKSKRLQLGKSIDSEQDYLLINAIRCNAICDDTDSSEVCLDKYNRYFDEVNAYDAYHKLSIRNKKNIIQNPDFVASKEINTFDLKNIVFRIIPTDQVSSSAAHKQNYDISLYSDDDKKSLDTDIEYLIRPVIVGSYLYRKLLEENYIIKNLTELEIDISKVILPSDLNPTDVRVLVLDEVIKWVLVDNNDEPTNNLSDEWEILT